MSRQSAIIGYFERDNENGQTVKCTAARCVKCDHSEWAYGTSAASKKRCLVMLNQNCPISEDNFYVDWDRDWTPEKP